MDNGSRTMYNLNLVTCSFTRVRCVPKRDAIGGKTRVLIVTPTCLPSKYFCPHMYENAFCAPQAPHGLRNLFYCRLLQKQTK